MHDASPRVRFPAHSPLRAELNRRVDDYFERGGLDRKGGATQLRKTTLMVLWLVGSWTLLVFWASSWWTGIPLAISLGLAQAGIGFAVMHDGNHGAASRSRWVNRLHAAALDAVGGSSYLWHFKHNVIHHSFTNVDGVDDDIDAGAALRMSEGQRRRWFHRFQHLYAVPLYALFFATKWIVVDDFVTWLRGSISGQRFPRPRGLDALQLVGGKLFWAVWALGIPLLVRPPLAVLGAYLLVMGVVGVTLALVFQLAHVVEETTFVPVPERGELERSFVEHQVATTADFAPGSPLVTWYVAGLNYQIEHHLFPKISHRHYPALAGIVRTLCAERGLRYHCHRTVWQALVSHFGFMRRVGRGLPAPLRAAAPQPALVTA